ncbi:MAG: cysteine synthase family protein [Deltaproteobacteria bacterium]|nr:cysteine synthase family protein [Deltaproteobacteria bacterium]
MGNNAEKLSSIIPATARSHLLQCIGNTPLVELTNLQPANGARILAKLEGCNPGGSVKDRPALWMIREAVEKGLLRPGQRILEPTSGNTGIGLAMVGASMGYKVTLTLPECVSIERRQTLIAYGAKLILTPHDEKTDGAIRRAHQIMEEHGDEYFMPNQFSNEANWRSHVESTAPEIWAQTGGDITAFVAGLGTSGTLMGVSRGLKQFNPGIKIIAAEPPCGHAIQGLKSLKEAIVPKIYDARHIDETLIVKDIPAYGTCQQLAEKEGLFCGMSSGAAVWAAIEVAKQLTPADTVVTILPDRGDRYLSTSLFRSICAECPP